MSTKAHRYTGLFVTLLAGAVFACLLVRRIFVPMCFGIPTRFCSGPVMPR